MTVTPITKKKYPAGTHPNSLAALTATWDSDKAREAQLKSAASRSANSQKRNDMKARLKLLKSMEEELRADKVDSVDVLRLIAYEKMEEGDMDAAIEILNQLQSLKSLSLLALKAKLKRLKLNHLLMRSSWLVLKRH